MQKVNIPAVKDDIDNGQDDSLGMIGASRHGADRALNRRREAGTYDECANTRYQPTYSMCIPVEPV